MSDESHGWEFFTGFILGGVVGAAVALLLAPQTGEETRALLRDQSVELRNRGVELSEQARTRAEQLAAEARQRSEELQQRGRMTLEEQRVRLQEAIEEGKDAATKKRDELTARLVAEKAKRAA
jgi:gas vesicle protein